MSSDETALRGCATVGAAPGLLLFGLAVLTRTIYLLNYRPTLDSYYFGLADNLITNGVLGFGGRPSTAFEPVYPMFLATARLVFGDRVLPIQLLQCW